MKIRRKSFLAVHQIDGDLNVFIIDFRLMELTESIDFNLMGKFTRISHEYSATHMDRNIVMVERIINRFHFELIMKTVIYRTEFEEYVCFIQNIDSKRFFTQTT